MIYRLMSRFMSNQTKYTLDSVLSKLKCPLLLLWGDLDPWVGPAKAIRIKEFYPKTSLVSLQAGHCPHDEVPEIVNSALINWLSSLKLDDPMKLLSSSDRHHCLPNELFASALCACFSSVCCCHRLIVAGSLPVFAR
ncbi:hypothetical protein Sjap_010333 [Stephania japonica]|uniref:Uncharacterized protein n=1 Tax=Stephania japonica TaxID=461633 RepID=A0AAP0J992_9MAGN